MKCRNNRNLLLFLFCLCLIGQAGGFQNQARADSSVINEIRKLRASLPVSDPSRTELSLRLADRLSDEVLVQGEKAKTSAVEINRKEAIALYKEVLPKMNGETKVKVQFQLARLYVDQAPSAESVLAAKSLFSEVASNAQTKELKRESTLRLAEMAEADKAPDLAATYFRKVLELCDGSDACSYSHYRLSWLSRNHEQIPAAIEEMKLALYDAKGQIREESLRDLISFMGLSTTTADADLNYVDALSTKLSRPNLIEDLAYSYFSNGNKASGVKVLALTHSRRPTIDSTVRLLEEYYGLRNWDQFRLLMTQFQSFAKDAAAKTAMKDGGETEKVCRRLATQLDGERTSDATKFSDFKEFTISYLEMFPNSSERAKIMEGLIAAEPSVDEKVAELNTWLNSPLYHLSIDDQMNLRELCASIAQKSAAQNEKANEIVINQMTALLTLDPSQAKLKAKAREYRYARARAYYAMKNFSASTPEFEILSAVGSETPDQFAVQSQNLLLDTYNQQKDFRKLVTTAHAWLDQPYLQKNPKLAQDLKEMGKVADEASFQMATAQSSDATQSASALTSFIDYCAKGKFLPQSCDNAKVLAVNLGKHPELLQVLELQAKQNIGKPEELAAEYENGGFYEQAGNELQKMSGKNASFRDEMKMALMFELARNLTKRDAILKALVTDISSRKMKINEAEEKALVATLRDASLLDEKLFKTATSDENKKMIAEILEEKNKSTPETKAFLVAQPSYQGSGWAALIQKKANQMATLVSKVKFYGKNGQVAFKKRVSALKDFNSFAEKYLSGGADPATRVQLLSLLKQNYDDVSREILASPLPNGLNDTQLTQVKTGLAEMSKPFSDKAMELGNLLENEKKKTPVEESRSVAQASSSSGSSEQFNRSEYEMAVKELHQNPKNTSALSQLKQIFESSKMNRLSSYFEGRVSAMGKTDASIKQ